MLALTRLNARIASVTEAHVGKESRSSHKQKDYTGALATLLSTTTNQPIRFFLKFAQYWYSEQLEVDARSEAIEACENFVFIPPCTATQILTLLLV